MGGSAAAVDSRVSADRHVRRRCVDRARAVYDAWRPAVVVAGDAVAFGISRNQRADLCASRRAGSGRVVLLAGCGETDCGRDRSTFLAPAVLSFANEPAAKRAGC